jgi:hypothetical protein
MKWIATRVKNFLCFSLKFLAVFPSNSMYLMEISRKNYRKFYEELRSFDMKFLMAFVDFIITTLYANKFVNSLLLAEPWFLSMKFESTFFSFKNYDFVPLPLSSIYGIFLMKIKKKILRQHYSLYVV